MSETGAKRFPVRTALEKPVHASDHACSKIHISATVSYELEVSLAKTVVAITRRADREGDFSPPLLISWPHQVSVGRQCKLEADIFFKFDGIWQPGPSIIIGNRVFIGRGCEFNIRKSIHVRDDCLVASGCKFIDHNHDMIISDHPMNLLPCPEAAIILEADVWLGVNVVVLQGVTIGRGAVIGAGAVVTKSVPANEIWAGIPARKIGSRLHQHQNKDEVVVL